MIFLASFAQSGCFDDQGVEILWDGLEVEFQDANLPNGLTQNFILDSPTQTNVVNLQVNLIGSVQPTPITLTIEPDGTSTAIKDVHYSLASNTITIPAGRAVAQFPVTVLTGNFEENETPDLILNIVSTSGAKISANYGSLTFKMRVPVCPSELEGTYRVFWESLTIGDGEGGASQILSNYVIDGFSTIQITSVSVGVYRLSDMSFGLYPGLFSDAAPIGTFTEICGDITGSDTNADRYGDPFTITGTADPIEEVINISWNNTWGDGGTLILTKE